MSHGDRNGNGWLVIHRKKDELIYIGDNILVMVKQIGENHVRLAINAPRHIAVDREEVRLRADYRDRGEPTVGEAES